MKKLALLLCLSLFSTTASAEPASSRAIPEILYTEESSDYPTWVSAEAAFTASGTLDPKLFSPARWDFLQQMLTKEPEGDCIQLGQLEFFRLRPDGRPDLASAVRSSDGIFIGKVTAQAGGFGDGLPGTLLRVQVEDVLKGPKMRLSEYYVFMPAGIFQAGRVKLCKTHPLYADLPAVGDELLVLPEWTGRAEEFLFTKRESGLITIRKNGSVSLPRRYSQGDKAFKGTARGELLSFIRSTLSRAGND